MKIKDIMTGEPRTCSLDTNFAAAAALMLDGDCGILPVVQDGTLVGVVTDRDMYIALATRNKRASELTVREVVQTPVYTCGPDDDVQAALEDDVKAGKFREDLFYRLQVMPIMLPPLRDRKGDVPLLASYFVDRYNREFKKRIRGLSSTAVSIVDQYSWPGNIRELRNAIERAMLLTTNDWIARAGRGDTPRTRRRESTDPPTAAPRKAARALSRSSRIARNPNRQTRQRYPLLGQR